MTKCTFTKGVITLSGNVVAENGLFRVEIMADSFVRIPKGLNPRGYDRITSIIATAARFSLAEINTHKMISKSSASSRAIPAKSMVERVKEKPFVPNRFPGIHKGMQAEDHNWIENGTPKYEELTEIWNKAINGLIEISESLTAAGISKQLSNRFVEPVAMHQMILTATEWENFTALRAHKDALYEMQILGHLVIEAINKSQPKELKPGEWHLPYGENLDWERLKSVLADLQSEGQFLDSSADELARMIIVARCARLSYGSFVSKDDYRSDISLYSRLVEDGHWSAFEHVAQAMTGKQYRAYSHTTPDTIEYGWCGNLRGFIQVRKHFPRDRENRSDPRILPLKL